MVVLSIVGGGTEVVGTVSTTTGRVDVVEVVVVSTTVVGGIEVVGGNEVVGTVSTTTGIVEVVEVVLPGHSGWLLLVFWHSSINLARAAAASSVVC